MNTQHDVYCVECIAFVADPASFLCRWCSGETDGETPAERRRSRRRATAYVRFLTLDHARAEAGRLLLRLEARHGAVVETSAPFRDPVASRWHQSRRDRVRERDPEAPPLSPDALGRLYRDVVRARYDRSNAAMFAARWRWEALRHLAERARSIARRLGCFDG